MGECSLLGAFVLLYLAIQFGIGVAFARLNRSKESFFIGDRKIPTFALSISIFATWFGAETCIGSAAAVFRGGLSASKAEPIGYALCILIAAVFIAPRLWNTNFTTLGDFFRQTYGPKTEALGTLVMIPGGLLWAATQTRAFGQILTTLFPLELVPAIILATCFVVVYTSFGGIMADIFTDTLQGIVLTLGIIVLFVLVLSQTNSLDWSNIWQNPTRLSLIAEDQSGLVNFDRILVPILGSIVAQELIAKMLAAKNKTQAKVSALYGAGFYLVVGMLPVLLGLIGPQIFPGLEDTESYLPKLAEKYLSPLFYTIFIGALISAILSTIDSVLLAISALITQNLLGNGPFKRPPVDSFWAKLTGVQLARICLVFSGLASLMLAIYGESVYEMSELASRFGTTGLVVITTFGLIFRKNCEDERPALLALGVGMVLTVLLDSLLAIDGAFTINLIIVATVFLGSRFALKSPFFSYSSSSSA